MDQDVSIRILEAVEADAALLLSLVHELAAYEHLTHLVTATEKDLRVLLFGPDAVAHALLAFDGDRAAGFAIYYFSLSTFAGRPNLFIEDLYVKSEHRERGIGKRLLVEVARRAVERRCARMEWLVLDWNESARCFYESMGATPRTEWVPYAISGEPLEKLARE